MLNHIQTLLNDSQLQQKIKQATDLAEVVKLIVSAGASKGYDFSKEAVSQVVMTLMPMESSELSEEDLLTVSGAQLGPGCYWTSKLVVEN